MWLELYSWIESFVAVSFDPYETLDTVETDLAFTDPFGWKCAMDVTIDNIMELLNTLDEHSQEAPDSLGDINQTKLDFSRQVIGEVIDKVNNVKDRLNIEVTKIKGLDGLRENIGLITNLIEYCRENQVDTAVSSEKFNEFNETNDNDITNILGIYNQDMMNIHQAVSDVCELYEDDDE